MVFRWTRGLASSAVVACGVLGAACGTDAVGVDACKQIESARCEQAPACGIALEPPYHTNGTDVTECQRYYDDACLHGLASGSDPGPTAVKACVAAIEQGDCTVVLTPSLAPACAWLTPASTGSDASSDASAPDAGGGSPDSTAD